MGYASGRPPSRIEIQPYKLAWLPCMAASTIAVKPNPTARPQPPACPHGRPHSGPPARKVDRTPARPPACTTARPHGTHPPARHPPARPEPGRNLT